MTSSPNANAHPPAGDAGGNFLLWREVDRLDRLIAETRADLAADVDRTQLRIDHLDEHGSRGVEALRLELGQLRRDLSTHEDMHDRAARESKAARRWTIGLVAGLIAPLYPLIIALLR